MRVGTRDRLVVGLLLLVAGLAVGGLLPSGAEAAEAICPGGSNPDSNVVLCDDFEDGTFGATWIVGSNQNTWPITEFVQCTQGTFGFQDGCAAWSNHLVFDDEWGFYGYDGWRAFSPQSEFYLRWYQYVSDPYSWGAIEDKSVMLHDAGNTITMYAGTSRVEDTDPNARSGMPFVANYQDTDFYTVNRTQNLGRNITLQPGKWYLFEWYVKLNTPGVSDGVTKLWIDDASQSVSHQTLRLHYADMRWLRTEDAAKMPGFVRLAVYDQQCDLTHLTCLPSGPAILSQSHRWDQIVISRTPIGPLGGTPDTTPPATPIGINVK